MKTDAKLTKAQQRVYDEVYDVGFVEHKVGFGTSQSNRPAWKLVELKLVCFGWGPRGHMFQTQGFLPLHGVET